jgi:hypothetical protein
VVWQGWSLCGPLRAHELGLLNNKIGGGVLLAGRVAVLAQDAADQAAQVGAGGFADSPVDGGVVADGLGDLAGDDAELGITEDINRAVVGGEGVVEGDLVFGEAERFAALAGLVHFLGQIDQRIDNFRHLDGTIVIAEDRLLEPFREPLGLHNTGAFLGADLVVEQLARQLQRQVALWHVAHFGQEGIGEDRDVRLTVCPIYINLNHVNEEQGVAVLIELDEDERRYVIALNNASDGAEVLADLSYLEDAQPGALTFDFTHMAAPLTQESREDYLPGNFGYQPTRQLVEIVAAIDACTRDKGNGYHLIEAKLPDPGSRVGDFLVRMDLGPLLDQIGLAVTFAKPASRELGIDDATRQNLISLARIDVSFEGRPNFAQLRAIRSRVECVFSQALPQERELAESFTAVVDEAVDNAVEYGRGGIIGGLYYPRAGEVEISLVNRQGGFGGDTPAEELDALINACAGSTRRTVGGSNGIAELSRLALTCFGTLALRNGSATLCLQPDGSITATLDETGLPTPGAAVTVLLQLLPANAPAPTDTLASYESILWASLAAYRNR